MIDRVCLEKLITLFNLKNKREIEKYCNSLVISSEGLATLILIARTAGLEPYLYACHFTQLVPEHLPPSTEELKALSQNDVGPLKGKAKKMMSKISQIFIDRRLLAAHLFYDPSQKYWHMFYFDQRDLQGDRNHWKNGPHIHYSHDSFVNEPLDDVWEKVCLKKPEFPKSIHIKYNYHHNREKAGKSVRSKKRTV
jgi:hypothetical protein